MTRQLVLPIPSLINLSFLSMTSGLDSRGTLLLVLADNGRKKGEEIRLIPISKNRIYQYAVNYI